MPLKAAVCLRHFNALYLSLKSLWDMEQSDSKPKCHALPHISLTRSHKVTTTCLPVSILHNSDDGRWWAAIPPVATQGQSCYKNRGADTCGSQQVNWGGIHYCWMGLRKLSLLISLHSMSDTAEAISLTRCDCSGKGAHPLLTNWISQQTRKPTERKMTWPFCLSGPLCHHYSWLFRA